MCPNYETMSIKIKSPLVVVFSEEEEEKLKGINKESIKLSNPKTGEDFIASQVFFVDSKFIPPGKIGITPAGLEILHLKPPAIVRGTLAVRTIPESYRAVKRRLMSKGRQFSSEEIQNIVNDIVHGKMSVLEKTAFVMTHHYDNWNMEEIELFTKAIANSGERIDHSLGGKVDRIVTDKHSLGGVPGNKVSLLIVPIIAASGLYIPKTSSRAITSPSGTADTMEALGCRVSFTADEIIEITQEINGLIAWGGALNLAPADDILISEVEYPLGLNPKTMMLASIMAKKVAMGVKHLVLDLPTGDFCKVKTEEEARKFGRLFQELGERLGIVVENGTTFGNLPVGHAIGPALEAREAISALINPQSGPSSLVEKSCALAGILLEMAGRSQRNHGVDLAKEILFSGKAYDKMKEIIAAQEGDPAIKAHDIEVGDCVFEYMARNDGYIVGINNRAVVQIAKAAGAPKDPKAGIYFFKKKSEVKRGEPIFRIYASTDEQLLKAQEVCAIQKPVTIEGMLLSRF